MPQPPQQPIPGEITEVVLHEEVPRNVPTVPTFNKNLIGLRHRMHKIASEQNMVHVSNSAVNFMNGAIEQLIENILKTVQAKHDHQHLFPKDEKPKHDIPLLHKPQPPTPVDVLVLNSELLFDSFKNGLSENTKDILGDEQTPFLEYVATSAASSPNYTRKMFWK